MSKTFREELIEILKDLPGNQQVGKKGCRSRARLVVDHIQRMTDFGEMFVADQLAELRGSIQRQASSKQRMKENKEKLAARAKEGPPLCTTACPFCSTLLTVETSARRKVGETELLDVEDIAEEVLACIDIVACTERGKLIPRGEVTGW